MNRQFLATRGHGAHTQTLISENGFVYAYADSKASEANCICSVAFFKANRARFHKAGWQFNHQSKK
jgi:hypothetical protein